MKLIIPHMIWKEIMTLTQLASPYEVTGIGLIEVGNDRETFYVKKIFLPRQTAGFSYATTEDYAMNEIIADVVSEDENNAEKLRFRWHSHAEGSVFFSSHDENDIASHSADWAVNLVVNVKGGGIARFDAFNPIRITNYPVDIFVDYTDTDTTQATRQLANIKRADGKADGKTKGTLFGIKLKGGRQ